MKVDKKWQFCLFLGLLLTLHEGEVSLELVSKELNHRFACLCLGFDFYEVKKYYLFKRKDKYFYTFNHLYSKKSSEGAKYHKSTTMTPNLPE